MKAILFSLSLILMAPASWALEPGFYAGPGGAHMTISSWDGHFKAAGVFYRYGRALPRVEIILERQEGNKFFGVGSMTQSYTDGRYCQRNIQVRLFEGEDGLYVQTNTPISWPAYSDCKGFGDNSWSAYDKPFVKVERKK